MLSNAPVLPVQPLSILCRSFKDIDTYTMGFPRGIGQGQIDVFRAVKHCLPGPVRMINDKSYLVPRMTTKILVNLKQSKYLHKCSYAISIILFCHMKFYVLDVFGDCRSLRFHWKFGNMTELFLVTVYFHFNCKQRITQTVYKVWDYNCQICSKEKCRCPYA